MTLSSGRDVVFRVHRPGYHSRAEIRSELAWLTALGRDGVVATLTPVLQADGSLIADLDDGGTIRHAVAFGLLPGKEPAEGEDLPRWYREFGRHQCPPARPCQELAAAGRLHAQALGL